jgi:hypothetical protein
MNQFGTQTLNYYETKNLIDIALEMDREIGELKQKIQKFGTGFENIKVQTEYRRYERFEEPYDYDSIVALESKLTKADETDEANQEIFKENKEITERNKEIFQRLTDLMQAAGLSVREYRKPIGKRTERWTDAAWYESLRVAIPMKTPVPPNRDTIKYKIREVIGKKKQAIKESELRQAEKEKTDALARLIAANAKTYGLDPMNTTPEDFYGVVKRFVDEDSRELLQRLITIKPALAAIEDED